MGRKSGGGDGKENKCCFEVKTEVTYCTDGEELKRVKVDTQPSTSYLVSLQPLEGMELSVEMLSLEKSGAATPALLNPYTPHTPQRCGTVPQPARLTDKHTPS